MVAALKQLPPTEKEEVSEPPGPTRKRLPNTRASIVHEFCIGGHRGCITVGLYPDGSPGELFIEMSKQGSTIRGLMDAIGVLASLAFQYGVPLESIATKFDGARFEPQGVAIGSEINFATSVLDYVFRWMQMRFGEGHTVR